MIINPAKWFGTRELSTVPPHFVKAPSYLTPKSKLWVISRLEGRYAVVVMSDDDDLVPLPYDYIFFEDPAEAMLYELRWSGGK